VTVVSGCLPKVRIGELTNPGENIHLIRHQDELAATLSRIVNSKATTSVPQEVDPHSNTIRTKNASKIKCKNELGNNSKLLPLTSFKGQTRAFLKIQDGCDGHCSYCIIPKTRPYIRSKPAEIALQEAQALVEAGHKEIVVTGVFLGAYGRASVRRKNRDSPQNGKLADLLEKMAKIPNLARIRLSSLEPADVTPRLLDAFCKHRNLMPHFHLSLQSGSGKILKKMCRQYDAGEFMTAIGLIKSRLDRPAITVDIIVGFPGETDADFEQTVEMAREVGFAKMHVFSFSPRKGTAAAAMQDTVGNKVIKERSRILHNIDVELGEKFRKKFIGETTTVLLENSNGVVCGRSERYFMVYLEKTAKRLQKNELVRVRLTRTSEKGAIGQAIKKES
jgi:threonylcarbamoyladenosine tRNA methylthiotransferase MtaB